MSEEGTDKEREFLVTGAKKYFAVEEAMEQFRHRVQDQVATLVADRLSEINKACEMDWTVDDIRQYKERNPDNYNVGKQIGVDGFGALYFYLKLWREKCEVYVDLYRWRMDLAGDLWKRAASNTIKGNDIWFHRDVPEDGIPEFGERLSEAIDDFVKFIGSAGGLKRYVPSAKPEQPPMPASPQ
jgi:hypothetical protein